MTSDTKIGLLLGLVFIFVIAFLINGLPSFRNQAQAHGNELSRRMIDFQEQGPGLAAQERQVYNQMNPESRLPDIQHRSPVFENLQYASPAQPEDVRARWDLPTPVDSTPTRTLIANVMGQFHSVPLGSPLQASASAGSFHVVQANENLAKIAKRYYGVKLGNQQANIKRIYQANKDILESPDRLRVGERLQIPPLPKSLRAAFSETQTVARQPVIKQTIKFKRYKVREGDSLWKIAQKVLGDGNRYLQIIKLNPDQLKNEDSLMPGMVLRLPLD